MRVKSKFFCDNQFIDWKKKDKKIHGFEVLNFFSKRTVTTNLNKLSSNANVRWYIFGNFTLSNSNILVEGLIRWKGCFEIFLIDHCAGDIQNKNIGGKY